MALRNLVASAALLAPLGGCVSQVQLANDKGQTAQCNAAGLGIVTSVLAASDQKSCIERYESQGYRQVPLSASPAAATTPAAPTSSNGAGQATQCNTYGWGLVSSLVAESMRETCVSGSPASGSTSQPAQK